MSLVEQVAALATRVGQELKALRLSKANDNAVVHLTGAETVAGVKTFSSAPLVPIGSLLANPVRRDDARLSDARTPTAHGHPQSDVTGLSVTLARRGDGARLVTDWKARSAGQALTDATLSDDGTAHKVSPTGVGVGATTAARGLEVTWPDSTGNALYIQQDTGGTVRRIGAVFAFGPCTSTNSQSLALCTWDLPFAQAGVNAQVHFWVNPAGWELGVAVNGAVIPLTSGLFATALAQDWTEYRAEVLVVGSTAFITLPDGSSREWTDSRIGSTPGYTACWEFFRNAGATTAPMALVEAWADSTPLPLGGTSPADVTRIVRRARFRDLYDFDAAAGTAADGNGLGWWSGANGGRGGWQPQPFITTYQRAPIGGTFDAGAVTSPWTPNASTATEQTASTAADLMIGAPTQGVDGQRLYLWITPAGASRIINTAVAIKKVAGIPTAGIQVPAGVLALAVLRWSTSRATWTCLALTLEA